MNDSMLSEQYAILLNDNDPKYYAQIPSVIFHCTYLQTNADGQEERKKLSANAIALYTLIKSIAGTNSACWVNRDQLAEMIDRSAGTITSAKKELQQPMEQLNGKSLITIVTKKKKHKDASGATDYHLITPTHIWPENNAFMALRSEIQNYPLGPINQAAPSNIDGVNEAPSNIDSVAPGAPSNIDTNKNRLQKKKYSVTDREPAEASAPVCNHSSSVSLSVSENVEDLRERAVRGMQSFGCDSNFIKEMLRRFTPKRIIDAGYYTNRQQERRQIANKFGYLRNAIEKGLQWTSSIA